MAESRLLLLALVPLLILLVAVGMLVGKSQLSGYAADGVLVAIKNVKTGKYLSVSQEDGLVRASADNSKYPNSHFQVVALSSSTVRLLRPVKVRAKLLSKKFCACSGHADEYGFGKYCHSWESQHHRPWCYVNDDCAGAKKGSKSRKHQACTSETGYLGPEGLLAPPGCECTGHESIHGFGAECKGWEYAGQTPWCYTHDNCSLAAGHAGSFESKHVECVRDVPPPPPTPPSSPPPIPSPPPPPSPPPTPWIENKDGWGATCPCIGHSSKLGFGAYCKGWEFEGQGPWCYVDDDCASAGPGGSFGKKFMPCTRKPSQSIFGRRLKVENVKREPTPLSKTVEEATGKKASSKAGQSALRAARRDGGIVTPTAKQAKLVAAKSKLPLGTPKPGKKLSTSEQLSRLLSATSHLQRVALVSQATGGFLSAEPPPHKLEHFIRADAEELSLRSVFALPPGRKGGIVAVASPALLSLCALKSDAPTEPLAACTAYPSVLGKRHTSRKGAGDHHRKTLLSPSASSEWVIELAKV